MADSKRWRASKREYFLVRLSYSGMASSRVRIVTEKLRKSKTRTIDVILQHSVTLYLQLCWPINRRALFSTRPPFSVAIPHNYYRSNAYHRGYPFVYRILLSGLAVPSDAALRYA